MNQIRLNIIQYCLIELNTIRLNVIRLNTIQSGTIKQDTIFWRSTGCQLIGVKQLVDALGFSHLVDVALRFSHLVEAIKMKNIDILYLFNFFG